MSEGLYPTFEVPEIPDETEDGQHYFPSVRFDWETGDFVLDGSGNLVESDGITAWRQWCIKCLYTEREQFIAYSADYGVETEDTMQLNDREAIESDLESTFTDALLQHPCTDSVTDFAFSWSSDSVTVALTVIGVDLNELPLKIEVTRE